MLFERGKVLALTELSREPQAVIFNDPDAYAVGIGYAVAKGWATYSGDGVFHITPAGRAALGELSNAV